MPRKKSKNKNTCPNACLNACLSTGLLGASDSATLTLLYAAIADRFGSRTDEAGHADAPPVGLADGDGARTPTAMADSLLGVADGGGRRFESSDGFSAVFFVQAY